MQERRRGGGCRLHRAASSSGPAASSRGAHQLLPCLLQARRSPSAPPVRCMCG
jgi:hypothetical protein